MFENIDDVYIIGSAKELNNMVSIVDARVQKMSTVTEQMKSVLANFGCTTFGNQYEKAVNAASSFSDILYNKSVELNAVQRDLVHYIDRIDIFNDRPPSGIPPRNFQVNRIKVSVNTKDDRFTKDIIIKLINQLNRYCQYIEQEKRTLLNEKTSIGSIWRDSQYRIYSSYIDEIVSSINKGVKELMDYSDYLQRKILNM